MIVKIYTVLWAMIAAAAAIMLLTGNFTELTLVVFGFIAFGMIFMGMIGVLPTTISHPAPLKMKAEKTKVPAKAKEGKGFHVPAVHAR